VTCSIVQILKDFEIPKRVAIAVSGGPDSMALVFAVSEAYPHSDIHALSVDHGMRAGSAQELESVGRVLLSLTNVKHHILTWEDAKPETKIMEEARNARYSLMAEKCCDLNVTDLCVAHHGDDQAETVLFRLAKGSGIDGLSGMSATTQYAPDLRILRPVLTVQKSDLIAFCDARGVDYIQDPSNKNEAFSRVRLRESMNVLEGEGLTVRRINTLGERSARARCALDWSADKAYESTVIVSANEIILQNIIDYPFEIVLRMVVKSIGTLVPQSGYPVRLERLESLVGDAMADAPFRKRSLAKVIFEKKKGTQNLRLTPEP
jgi:tRNA(Ile)-lysidine synthase